MDECSGFIERLIDQLDDSDIIEIILKNSIVNVLIRAHSERSLNCKQFAAALGVSPQTLRRWESGDCNFTIKTIAVICARLGLEPHLQLLEYKKEAENEL